MPAIYTMAHSIQQQMTVVAPSSCFSARRGLGSLWDVTAMPPKSATSMAPKATVPRMRPMLPPVPRGAAQRPGAVFDPAPSTSGATHTSSEDRWHQRQLEMQ